jgi:hypothetical protein
MQVLQVFDPPMCCSTGVCCPEVDPALVRFSSDLMWVQDQGVTVERYNLAQTPMAFAEDDLVRARLIAEGEAALPLLLVDGKVLASGEYPRREELAGFLGLNGAEGGKIT